MKYYGSINIPKSVKHSELSENNKRTIKKLNIDKIQDQDRYILTEQRTLRGYLSQTIYYLSQLLILLGLVYLLIHFAISDELLLFVITFAVYVYGVFGNFTVNFYQYDEIYAEYELVIKRVK